MYDLLQEIEICILVSKHDNDSNLCEYFSDGGAKGGVLLQQRQHQSVKFWRSVNGGFDRGIDNFHNESTLVSSFKWVVQSAALRHNTNENNNK